MFNKNSNCGYGRNDGGDGYRGGRGGGQWRGRDNGNEAGWHGNGNISTWSSRYEEIIKDYETLRAQERPTNYGIDFEKVYLTPNNNQEGQKPWERSYNTHKVGVEFDWAQPNRGSSYGCGREQIGKFCYQSEEDDYYEGEGSPRRGQSPLPKGDGESWSQATRGGYSNRESSYRRGNNYRQSWDNCRQQARNGGDGGEYGRDQNQDRSQVSFRGGKQEQYPRQARPIVRIIGSPEEDYKLPNQWVRYPCPLCYNFHKMDNCYKITDIHQRKILLEDRGFCCRCGALHPTMMCTKLDTRCIYCGDPSHHGCICPQPETVFKPHKDAQNAGPVLSEHPVTSNKEESKEDPLEELKEERKEEQIGETLDQIEKLTVAAPQDEM